MCNFFKNKYENEFKSQGFEVEGSLAEKTWADIVIGGDTTEGGVDDEEEVVRMSAWIMVPYWTHFLLDKIEN